MSRFAATLAILFILCHFHLPITANEDASPPPNEQVQHFIATIEQLVLNTTDQALLVTRNVYLNISRQMTPALRQATGAMMQRYIQQVDAALQTAQNYTEKRKLFQQFKRNSLLIEQLRAQLSPLQAPFQFPLISDEFYNTRRATTEFDFLYMAFMRDFGTASAQLWAVLSERTVEEEQELLELLDEIDKEEELREKDKLYDEFIEMFLFKPNESEVERRELF